MAIEVQGLTPLLSVFEMPRALSFYRDLLGFSVVQTSPLLSDNPDHVNWAMLRLNNSAIMLNTAYDPDDQPAQPEAERFAGHGDTCLYFDCPDVDAAYRTLRERGVDPEPPKIAPYGMNQLYLKDPDGYSLCFQWTV